MPPQRALKPKPKVVRKSTLNLDSIFNHVFSNVIGEPITPQKVAIFYLVKNLYDSHFGYRPSTKVQQFTAAEKTKVFTIVFGLITLEDEISYKDLRTIVRFMDGELGRSTYYYFVTLMEQIALGKETVDIRVGDSFFTGKRDYNDPMLVLPPTSTKPLPFMTNKSYMFIWLKRIIGMWIRSNQAERFRINEEMRKWLVPIREHTNLNIHNFRPVFELPHKINSSTRARFWITDQLFTIQLAPSRAMRYDDILKWTEMIINTHPDVFSVHLLESVVYFQKMNPPKAIESIKKFFDLSMFKLNDNVINASQSHRLARPCQTPLRYAPLLHGRICRLFGDFRNAEVLFTESIQQAQLTMDDLCNRMANLELAAIEVLRGPLLERNYEHDGGAQEKDKRIVQQNLHRAAELDQQRTPEHFAPDPEEGLELHEQLLSMAKMLVAVEDMLDGRYFVKSSEYIEVCLRVRVMSDHAQKTRQCDDTAMSLAASNLVRNGMYAQGRRVCGSMHLQNFKNSQYPVHETEPSAITSVNYAYSLAASGDYHKAFDVIAEMEKVYTPDLNWMSARHVTICRSLIYFEKAFLADNYEECDKQLKLLSSIAPLDHVLRKSLYLATTGRTSDAIRDLTDFKCGDVVGCIRIRMQLATIHTASGNLENALHELEEACKMAKNTSLRNIRSMICRRMATVLMCQRNYIEGVKLLTNIQSDIEQFGSAIEKTIFYYSMARCLREVSSQDYEPEPYCAKARALASKCEWKSMEKLILVETCMFYNSVENTDCETTVMEQFEELDSQHPSKVSWMLI